MFSIAHTIRCASGANNYWLFTILNHAPAEPQPSETDVRLAYLPKGGYLIVGLGGEATRLGAFRISESEGSWEPVEYEIIPDSNP